MSQQMEERLVDVVPVRAGIAGSALFAVAAICVALHAAVLTGFATYLLACSVAAGLLTLGYACFVGLSGWAFLTGFVVNADGQLTFAPGDLVRLAAIVAVSAAVSALVAQRLTRRPTGRSAHGSSV